MHNFYIQYTTQVASTILLRNQEKATKWDNPAPWHTGEAAQATLWKGSVYTDAKCLHCPEESDQTFIIQSAITETNQLSSNLQIKVQKSTILNSVPSVINLTHRNTIIQLCSRISFKARDCYKQRSTVRGAGSGYMLYPLRGKSTSCTSKYTISNMTSSCITNYHLKFALNLSAFMNRSPIAGATEATVDRINKLEPKYLTTLKSQRTSNNCESEDSANNIDLKWPCPFDKPHYAKELKDCIWRNKKCCSVSSSSGTYWFYVTWFHHRCKSTVGNDRNFPDW